ncbi:hypothetical protein RSal33209_2677 [Renibacterium salmoninarum ATCC 33209]|uniref:Uncharacterized protein n=1 Tax=Renibacterium salmoninarum (strain ATCC 33209 / DSM 20767 / JCM 11484 / NBRC 15589 / NCIMB 2235) TaxID=288705 RepID=A9WRX0_RENSM|nr:hypothetical protein RSal33209_2677 [Renibacterium salmoninarum ATCC 33209]
MSPGTASSVISPASSATYSGSPSKTMATQGKHSLVRQLSQAVSN